MAEQWMAFHHYCSLHNALWWKCVCLEHCKWRKKATIRIL